MKNILGNIREYMNDDNNPNRKPMFFFGFYFIFFVVLFGIIFFKGDKDYLNQEYEKNDSPENHGVLCVNCVYDYKVTIDGVLHDYYGKKNNGVESFKYNNFDYYYDQDRFYVHKDLWTESNNPYQFYELLNYDNIYRIVDHAFLLSSEADDNGKTTFHYLISNNTLNQILYDENTDYDEEADSFDMTVDSNDHIEKVYYQLNHFCIHKDNCQSTLTIEMTFEMFDNVNQIDSPIP